MTHRASQEETSGQGWREEEEGPPLRRKRMVRRRRPRSSHSSPSLFFHTVESLLLRSKERGGKGRGEKFFACL